MKPLGDTNTHFWLAQRMAKLTETNLARAMEQAKLSQEEWAAMVSECRQCDWTKGCKRFLAAKAGSTIDTAPETCRNQQRFDALKSALEEVET